MSRIFSGIQTYLENPANSSSLNSHENNLVNIRFESNLQQSQLMIS